jgi:CheY-like chemotaxis protein
VHRSAQVRCQTHCQAFRHVGGHIVLVALTGYGREKDKHEAMVADFDYQIVKPVAPDALHGLMARLGKDKWPPPLPIQ